MSNLVFPTLPGLEWGVEWVPQFKTVIQQAVSGKEYRASLMASPLYKITLSYEFLKAGTATELATLFGFFLSMRGSYDDFLYTNPSDNTVTDQVIGVSNGTNKEFQLVRAFGSAFLEPVCNINTVTNVKVNGVTKVLNTDYTVSSTGVVVFTNTPTSGNITWTGTYYYRARFSGDEMTFANFMKDFWEAKSIELTACLGTKI